MSSRESDGVIELPVVVALRKLSVFGYDQAGAYREHFASLASTLGEDIETKLATFLRRWGRGSHQGTVLLTGNAGTGKTAAAQAYCVAVGATLPESDELVAVAPSRWVMKDLSGVPTAPQRADTLQRAFDLGLDAQVLVCVNEGILRDALTAMGAQQATETLEDALRSGASHSDGLWIVNVNRQRPTGKEFWGRLLDYLTRIDLWTGCEGCPFDDGGCPMRSNAEQMRRLDVREQMRTLFRLASGEAVPTLREVLAILSWSLVGNETCPEVKQGFRDRGKSASTAADAYYARLLGAGLATEAAERSPLMTGLIGCGLGQVSDLEVDSWLRDSSGAPPVAQELAGVPAGDIAGARGLDGSRSPLDRVNTKQQQMTFHALGEMISTDEDTARVDDGMAALVESQDSVPPAQDLWRRRIFFEAADLLGGHGRAAERLLRYRRADALAALADHVVAGTDTFLQLRELVRGLNFLVTGFPSSEEGMIVPDSACLFARDPGAFRGAAPSLVHSLIAIERLSLSVRDSGVVEDLLDIDHVDVVLSVDRSSALSLRIGPRMHEAIREAADYGGPVGQGVAEMNDLRSFYGRLAETAAETPLRITDPASRPPALRRVTAPHPGAM